MKKHPEDCLRLSLEFHNNHPSNVEFKAALEKNDAQALYVLFEKINKFPFDNTMRVFEDFKIQKLLEDNYVYYLDKLLDDRGTNNKFEFVLDRYGTLRVKGLTGDNKLKLSDTITKSIFDFSPKMSTYYSQHYMRAYDYRHTSSYKLLRESNSIQLTPAKKMPGFSQDGCTSNPEAIEHRELFHLKSNLSTQILLTLEYYIKHIEKLSQTEHQKYLEANLFQPGLLTDLLENREADLFKLMAALIKKGMKYFSKQNLLTANSLALIRLQTQVIQYAYELRNDPSLLKKQFLLLSNWIELNPQDERVQATLHCCRFELAVLSSKWETVFGDTHFDDLLASYFYLRVNDSQFIWMDANKRFRNDRAAFRFGSFMIHMRQKDPNLIKKDRVMELLQRMGIINKNEAVVKREQFPIYEIHQNDETFEVNVAQGLIYKGSMAITATPIVVMRHPLFERAGIVCATKALQSADGCLTEVKAGGEVFRFIKTNSGLDLQKQFFVNGESRWYQLTANSEAQTKFYQTSDSSVINFGDGVPDSLQDCHHLTWLGTENQSTLLISDETLQPVI